MGEATSRRLADRIRDRSAVVGVVGLGHVGLPRLLMSAENGFPSVGFDIDPLKVAALGRGECDISHLDPSPLRALVTAGRLTATTDFARLAEVDILVLAVPTPLTSQRTPDLSYIEKSTQQVAASLRRGQLVILESTTYPGTTEELVAAKLAASGLRCGEDFFLAYSPARDNPGALPASMTATPKLVGGVDKVSGDLAEDFYNALFTQTVRLSSARAAEATKLVENIFRAVNIGLVNELKIVYDRLGIDIWEVLDAAATKPFGFMRFDPGPGWGGHCIPLDPYFLSWKAREFGVLTSFIELAGEVNARMPHFVIGKLTAGLNDRGKPVAGSRVLLLGLAYKKDIGDLRESPAHEIVRLLGERKAVVHYHDPHVATATPREAWAALGEPSSVPLTREILEASDAVVVLTDHSAVDYALVARHAPLIVDTRGVYRGHRGHAGPIIKA